MLLWCGALSLGGEEGAELVGRDVDDDLTAVGERDRPTLSLMMMIFASVFCESPRAER